MKRLKPIKTAQQQELARAFKEYQQRQREQKAQRIGNIQGWIHIRRNILDRDDYSCRICGTDQDEEMLHVHHVDYDRNNNKPRNLVTLCQPCHKMVHMHGYRPDGTDDEPWGER
jgi:5-methylcytosine-specific restriction endonuclease McrA